MAYTHSNWPISRGKFEFATVFDNDNCGRFKLNIATTTHG